MLEEILRDTWFYQRIWKIGYEEGRKQIREKERKRKLQRLDQFLVDGVEAKFPSLVPLARRYADTMNDPDALQKITFQLITIQDQDVFCGHLLAALSEQQDSN
jgi:hypothetical protein